MKAFVLVRQRSTGVAELLSVHATFDEAGDALFAHGRSNDWRLQIHPLVSEQAPAAYASSLVRVPLFTRLALALAEAADRQDIGNGQRCWCSDCFCLGPPNERSREECHRFNALLKEAGL